MSKRSWVYDIALLGIIIVMGYFVYLELDRMFYDFRNQQRSTSQEVVPHPTMTMVPTIMTVKMIDAGPAPNFELETLEGETLTLEDFRGKAVMINFWATWCYPCRAEFPLFVTIEERYKGKLAVLAVNTGEGKDRVATFVETFGFDLTFVLDPANTTPALFQVRGIPTTVFVDAEGNLRAKHIGELDEALINTYLTRIGINE